VLLVDAAPEQVVNKY